MKTPAITTTLVVGATGATGKHVVAQLLKKNQNVRVIVRSKQGLLHSLEEILPGASSTYTKALDITEAAVLDLSNNDLENKVKGCDAVVSCLGHNMTFKGICGNPRGLVTESIKRLYSAIGDSAPKKKTKLILMGSDGVANPAGGDDMRTFGERMVLALIRAMIPPHRDNEAAAAFLSDAVAQGSEFVEWAVVRPTDLINGAVSEYSLYEKPQGGLFGAGQTTRANVAKFMVDMILNGDPWQHWKFKMPVLHDFLDEKK